MAVVKVKIAAVHWKASSFLVVMVVSLVGHHSIACSKEAGEPMPHWPPQASLRMETEIVFSALVVESSAGRREPE